MKAFHFVYHKRLSKGMRLHKFTAEALLCAPRARLHGCLCIFMCLCVVVNACLCDRAPLFLYANEVPVTFMAQCLDFSLGTERTLVTLV